MPTESARTQPMSWPAGVNGAAQPLDLVHVAEFFGGRDVYDAPPAAQPAQLLVPPGSVACGRLTRVGELAGDFRRQRRRGNIPGTSQAPEPREQANLKGDSWLLDRRGTHASA